MASVPPKASMDRLYSICGHCLAGLDIAVLGRAGEHLAVVMNAGNFHERTPRIRA
jgi:hypothetical protein